MEFDEKEVISDFEELFGLSSDDDEDQNEDENLDDEETEDEEENEETEDEDENEDEEDEDSDDDDSDDDDDDSSEQDNKPKKKSKNKKEAHIEKSNKAFAELRVQNKKQSQLLKSLGKAIGLDDKADIDTIAAEVQKLLLQKQSKDTNIPVEILKEIESLRSLAAENEQLKIENTVKQEFANLSEKYDLDADAMEEFAEHLAEIGKNPLEGVEVDIEAEYIKLHQKDIIAAAVKAALEGEQARKNKVKKHAGGTSPGKAGDTGGNEKEISTVADLDRVFNSMDL